MQKLVLSKFLKRLSLGVIGVITVKPDQQPPSQSNAGFTFIELLIVIMMVGILSAIAAPNWISFANQRRVNAVNDDVLGVIQSAQREAIRNKLSYSVSFRTDAINQIPQIAVYSDSALVNNNSWKPLGADLQLKPEQIWMGTNLSGKNTTVPTVPSVSPPPNTTAITTTTPTITFDYTGALPRDASTKLKIVVAARQSGNSTQPLDSTKRCVIVETLLGSMRTAKGTDCN